MTHKYTQTVSRFRDARVLCVGDIMLDTFNHGTVERISPERPVPVFRPGNPVHVPGGAANVAFNVVALGAQCSLVGCIGEDETSLILKNLLDDHLLTPHLFPLEGFTTTHKLRLTAGAQHLLRMDTEYGKPIPDAIHNRMLSLFTDIAKSHDVLIISDYAKGLFNPSFLADLIAIANGHHLPIIVDPKGSDFLRYAGSTLITPNSSEAEMLTGIKIASDYDAETAGTKLLVEGKFKSVLITRGSRGMTLCSTESSPIHFANDVLDVYDVVGAGDTVVATLACAVAVKAPISEAAECANIAAGIVVGKRDTATVSLTELLQRLNRSALQPYAGDSYSPLLTCDNELVDFVAGARHAGKRIGFTNGVFDIIHSGHVSLLRFARAACDVLIVALNSDLSVQQLNKGPDRPINTATDRAFVLAAFEMVDATIIFDELTPLRLIQLIQPDVLIKGADYTLDAVVGADFVTSYGGDVRLAPIEDGKSSTRLIELLTETNS